MVDGEHEGDDVAAVWRTAGDHKVCDACKALNGKADGDGWSSALKSEPDCYVQDVAGNWVRERPKGKLVGPPPLHPNCRCKLVSASGRRIRIARQRDRDDGDGHTTA